MTCATQPSLLSVQNLHTEGSKCNIPCYRRAQHLRRTRGYMTRESGAYVTQMLRAKFAYDVRHVARVSCKCCAHLPRVDRAKRDVTFGLLYMTPDSRMSPAFRGVGWPRLDHPLSPFFIDQPSGEYHPLLFFLSSTIMRFNDCLMSVSG
jgi:hypothetical protein